MPPRDLAEKLQELERLDRKGAEALLKQLYGRPLKVPSRLDFVRSILAYRLQENAYGGLKESTRKRLRAIAADIEADPTGDFLRVPRIKPGTRLVREWQGKIHNVTVVEDGFLYNAKRYKSLSEIARLITGTRWSGPLFFGLKKPVEATTKHAGRQSDR
jgi:hypothetical protein